MLVQRHSKAMCALWSIYFYFDKIDWESITILKVLSGNASKKKSGSLGPSIPHPNNVHQSIYTQLEGVFTKRIHIIRVYEWLISPGIIFRPFKCRKKKYINSSSDINNPLWCSLCTFRCHERSRITNQQIISQERFIIMRGKS